MDVTQFPFRDPRYAARNVEVLQTPRGDTLIKNLRPYSTAHQTMTSPLSYWASAAPHRVWLAERSGDGWRRMTFGEAHQRISALAGGLLDLGLTAGNPLLIMARNSIEHALIAYAAMSQGMPIAPLPHKYGMSDALLIRQILAHAVNKIRPAAVYVEDPHVFAHGLSADGLAGVPVIAQRNARPGDIAFTRLANAAPTVFTAQPYQHARYLLTSGSTGLPKAVICRHDEISLNVAQVAACFEDPEPPIMLHSAPWSHSLGLSTGLHQSLHRGGTLHIDHGLPVAGHFDETLRNLQDVRPTYLSMVPVGWTLLAEELERSSGLADAFFSRVRLLQYGGAALGQDIADRIQKVAVRTVGERISFASAYGATETGPIVANVHWVNAKMGLVGLPIPGTVVKLVPIDDQYEIRVSGPQVSQGYLDEPEQTQAAFDEDGFYRMGDTVRLADTQQPRQGMRFGGRLSENFKLASGVFVAVDALRNMAIHAIGPAVTDAVVCGEGEMGIGLLLYPNPELPATEVMDAVRAGLQQMNAKSMGSNTRIARALLLPEPPRRDVGEVTDKGNIAQIVARRYRAEDVKRLFADASANDIVVAE